MPATRAPVPSRACVHRTTLHQLPKEKWEEAAEHAKRAVVPDSRLRAWLERSNMAGLVFPAVLGEVDLKHPEGEGSAGSGCVCVRACVLVCVNVRMCVCVLVRGHDPRPTGNAFHPAFTAYRALRTRSCNPAPAPTTTTAPQACCSVCWTPPRVLPSWRSSRSSSRRPSSATSCARCCRRLRRRGGRRGTLAGRCMMRKHSTACSPRR